MVEPGHAPALRCGGDVDAYIEQVRMGLIADRPTRYCIDVVDGKIPAGKLNRLACQRHLDDLRHGPARGLAWHLDAADYAINFFPLLRHSKGEWRGQPVMLQPWQCFTVGSVYGWKRTGDGLRRYVKAFEEVPKKNGKSTKLAGVGLFALVADGEQGAEVYAIATKRDQARIIFNEAREMVRTSPELKSRLRPFQNNISDEETYSKFEPLSADDKTADGLNPSMALADELHRHKKRDLLNLFDNALGARRQPILWIITTAGDDKPGTPYDTEREYARKVLEGALEDDTYFAFIACADITGADDDDDWRDETTWIKANPNYGISVKAADMARMAAKAAGAPDALADFLRFRLGVRQSDVNASIRMVDWKRNTQGPIDLAALAGRRCVIGVDLSAKTDITATVKVFPPLEDTGRWIWVCKFWMPEARVDFLADMDRAPYRRWVEEGWISTCDGNRIDYNDVLASLMADYETYQVSEVTFDPWNAGTLEADLMDQGVPVSEFRQGMFSYSHPTKEFLDMVLDAKLEHGGNPVLQLMASNLVCKTDDNKNKMPAKGRSRGRIDGISAGIMALGRAIAPGAEAPKGPSVYEGRGILMV
jgi:phage terminase large subunit-like protein